jgi:hypothetical protein
VLAVFLVDHIARIVVAVDVADTAIRSWALILQGARESILDVVMRKLAVGFLEDAGHRFKGLG